MYRIYWKYHTECINIESENLALLSLDSERDSSAVPPAKIFIDAFKYAITSLKIPGSPSKERHRGDGLARRAEQRPLSSPREKRNASEGLEIHDRPTKRRLSKNPRATRIREHIPEEESPPQRGSCSLFLSRSVTRMCPRVRSLTSAR